jgi:hypothetical protein
MTHVDKQGSRRLRDLKVKETSGVDHPAHKHPGWLIMKSVGDDTAQALAVALGKEMKMGTQTQEAPTLVDLVKSLTPEAVETIRKAITAEDIAPVRDQVADLWKVLRDLTDKGDDNTPSTEAPAAEAVMAADPAQVLASAELQKAIGPNGVAMLKAMHDRQVAAEATLDAEREANAIAKARADYGDIMEPTAVEAFAKAMRAFEAMSPEGASAVREALEKSKSLNASAEAIITKEIGGRGAVNSDSPMGKLQTIAKAYVEAGTERTLEAAFAKACADNPDIYAAHRAGEER